MADFFPQLFRVVHQVVSSGSVVALSAICGLQYLVYMHRQGEMRRKNELLQSQMEGLETELVDVQKDRSLARLENQILREFVTETEINRALGLLLKRFVPNTTDGFGVLVRLAAGRKLAEQSRGLSDESRENIQIDAGLLRRVANERSLVVEEAELAHSELLQSISHKDRGKVRRLFLVAVGDSDNLAGVLVTTSLFPEGAPLEQQLELARRLMFSIAGDLRQSQVLEQQQHQLRSTSEILELRSIVDRHYETPLAMIEAFVDLLRQKLGAERAVLYLMNSDANQHRKAVVRAGTAPQSSVVAQWNKYEDLLTESVVAHRELSTWVREDLEAIGVQSLIGSALAAPLVRNDRPLGAICFTRQSQTSFDDAQRELADWGARYLSDTLLRLLNHAVTERQARQDPLTGLANRRAFDLQIERDLNWARETGNECALLLCDLDHFKSVNDKFGHQAGDEVLRATARILQEQILEIRSGDRALAARYGGEEFAVLLPGIGLAGASRIAEAIRSALQSTPVRYQHAEIRATLSVGIAIHPRHGSSPVELIAAADTALYQAKDAGRNRVLCLAEAAV